MLHALEIFTYLSAACFNFYCNPQRNNNRKNGVLIGFSVNDMIYLLTAIGLSPGDSTHLHKKYMEQNK